MRILQAVFGSHYTAAGNLELCHCVLNLLRGVSSAPVDDLCVELAALFGSNCLKSGGAVFVVEVVKVKTECLNSSLVNAGTECADSDVVAVLGLEQAVRLECGGLVAGTGVLTSCHGVGGVQIAAVACLNLELSNVNYLTLAGLENVDICCEDAEYGSVCRGKVVEPGLADDGVAVLFAVETHPA